MMCITPPRNTGTITVMAWASFQGNILAFTKEETRYSFRRKFLFFGKSVLVFILSYMTRACIPEWRLGRIIQPLGHADPLTTFAKYMIHPLHCPSLGSRRNPATSAQTPDPTRYPPTSASFPLHTLLP